MAMREACRPSEMQTSCSFFFFIVAVEIHSVKGAFTVPWAQFPWLWFFFLTVSYSFHCIYLLSLPSWNFLAIQPMEAQIVSCFVSLKAKCAYAIPLSRAAALNLDFHFLSTGICKDDYFYVVSLVLEVAKRRVSWKFSTRCNPAEVWFVISSNSS